MPDAASLSTFRLDRIDARLDELEHQQAERLQVLQRCNEALERIEQALLSRGAIEPARPTLVVIEGDDEKGGDH